MVNRSPLILPAGVVPPVQSAPQSLQHAPFDRKFFESVLPSAIQSYCAQVSCTMPLVRLYTVDGSRHYIRAISAVSDSWVALHTQEELNEQPIQVFIPYLTIVRVEIHPDISPDLRHFGFLTESTRLSAAELAAAGREPALPPSDEAEGEGDAAAEAATK